MAEQIPLWSENTTPVTVKEPKRGKKSSGGRKREADAPQGAGLRDSPERRAHRTAAELKTTRPAGRVAKQSQVLLWDILAGSKHLMGTVTLRDNTLVYDGDIPPTIMELLEESRVGFEDDPKGYLRVLPFRIRGSYLWAEFIRR